jgi:hypothetical protein
MLPTLKELLSHRLPSRWEKPDAAGSPTQSAPACRPPVDHTHVLLVVVVHDFMSCHIQAVVWGKIFVVMGFWKLIRDVLVNQQSGLVRPTPVDHDVLSCMMPQGIAA